MAAIRDSLPDDTAAALDEIRRRAYADDRKPPRTEPRMITFDLASGTTAYVARCCDHPDPYMRCGRQQGKSAKDWHADLECRACGCTLAVLRWLTSGGT